MPSVIFVRKLQKEVVLMEEIINSYYANNAKKLRTLVDKILFKLRFTDVDNEDFYSLANEIFVDVLRRYDEKQDFDGFLYSCLCNKFKTEMTRRNREKRKADKMALSWEEKVGNDEDGVTIGDTIADKNTIESNFFEEREETYSEKMSKYLGRLSNLQKEVLRLISIGFTPNGILDELHINHKMYDDCYSAIHSYRNTIVLM
jgi:DNA-directed RNA polymerase specialized sigma24 family protein